MTTHELIAGILACAAFAAVGLMLLGMRRRDQPGGPGLILMSAGLVVWTSSNAVQTLATNRTFKDVTLNVTFTAVWAVAIGSWW